MAEPQAGWVYCPGCGELIALEAQRCGRCGRAFEKPVYWAGDEHARPPRLTIGFLMLLIVPLAVLLAVMRFSPCVGGGLIYLFALAVPRTRKVLAVERSRGLPVSTFDVAPAFVVSLAMVFLLTALCIFVFLLPVLAGAAIGVVVAELGASGDHAARWQITLAGILLGAGIGPVLLFKTYRHIIRDLWSPDPQPARMQPRHALVARGDATQSAKGAARSIVEPQPVPDSSDPPQAEREDSA